MDRSTAAANAMNIAASPTVATWKIAIALGGRLQSGGQDSEGISATNAASSFMEGSRVRLEMNKCGRLRSQATLCKASEDAQPKIVLGCLLAPRHEIFFALWVSYENQRREKEPRPPRLCLLTWSTS
jgi:hypothetical protein